MPGYQRWCTTTQVCGFVDNLVSQSNFHRLPNFKFLERTKSTLKIVCWRREWSREDQQGAPPALGLQHLASSTSLEWALENKTHLHMWDHSVTSRNQYRNFFGTNKLGASTFLFHISSVTKPNQFVAFWQQSWSLFVQISVLQVFRLHCLSDSPPVPAQQVNRLLPGVKVQLAVHILYH